MSGCVVQLNWLGLNYDMSLLEVYTLSLKGGDTRVSSSVCKTGAKGNSSRGIRSKWLRRGQESLLFLFCLLAAGKQGAFS